MWEKLTPADLQQVRYRLTAKRADARRRYEEELDRLDIDQAEVEQFARRVAAFADKHLERAASASFPMAPEENTTQSAEFDKTSTAVASQKNDLLPSTVELHHQPSPNFETPFRRLAEESFSIASLIAILSPSA